jgi:hypothetical protein
MLSVAIVDVWLGFHDVICGIMKVWFYVIKQPKIMNHLGGSGNAWFMLSGCTGVISMAAPCASHLRLATQEQRD